MLYVPNSVEDIKPADLASSAAALAHTYYRGDDDGNTPKRQSHDSETSFDSGYFSPLASARSLFTSPLASRPPSFTPTLQEPATYSTTQQSPLKPPGSIPSAADDLARSRSGYTDLSFLDDWDKNFIDNFEENLFSLDCEDLGLLEGIFKSPLKSPLRILSPAKRSSSLRYSSPSKNAGSVSPYKMSSYRSPYRHHKGFEPLNRNLTISNRMSLHSHVGDQSVASHMPAQMSGYQADGGPKLLTAGIVHGSAVNILSASENNPASASNHTSTQKHLRIKPKGQRKTKENYEPYQHTSRQKLQMARTNFRLSLQKAIESADCRSSQRRSSQYPQLSKALSKPATEGGPSPVRVEGKRRSSRSRRPSSNPYLDEDAEVPRSWIGNAGSEVGAYEVEPQSECKVVIRKKRR